MKAFSTETHNKTQDGKQFSNMALKQQIPFPEKLACCNFGKSVFHEYTF